MEKKVSLLKNEKKTFNSEKYNIFTFLKGKVFHFFYGEIVKNLNKWEYCWRLSSDTRIHLNSAEVTVDK